MHHMRLGHHMNKKLWNSVYNNEDVSDQMVYEMIDDSYVLVVASMTKKLKIELKKM